MKKITAIITSLFLIIALSGCSVVDKVQVKMDGEKYGSADAYVITFSTKKPLNTATEKFFNQLIIEKGDIEIKNADIKDLQISDKITGKIKFTNCTFPFNIDLGYIGGQVEFDGCSLEKLSTVAYANNGDILLTNSSLKHMEVKSNITITSNNSYIDYLRTRGASGESKISILGDIGRIDIGSAATFKIDGNIDTMAIISEEEPQIEVNGIINNFATQHNTIIKGQTSIKEMSIVKGNTVNVSADVVNSFKDSAVSVDTNNVDSYLIINKKRDASEINIIWDGYIVKTSSMVIKGEKLYKCDYLYTVITGENYGFDVVSMHGDVPQKAYYDKNIGGYCFDTHRYMGQVANGTAEFRYFDETILSLPTTLHYFGEFGPTGHIKTEKEYDVLVEEQNARLAAKQ